MTEMDFDWNWAEKEESLRAEEEALQEILSQQPDIKLLMAAHGQRFDFELAQSCPSLEARTPYGIPSLPANLNIYACALINPDEQNALSWKNWLHGAAPQDDLPKLAIDAISQVQLGLGPLNFISPALLDDTFNVIESSEPAQAELLATQALICLFQPFDERPDRAEDMPYAPCCSMLLRHGANPSGRAPKTGASALSGINSMLTEAEISMAKPSKIKDLLLCAELILRGGASTDLVRELPPLATIVPNQELLDLLNSNELRKELLRTLTPSPEQIQQAAPAEPARQEAKPRRL